MKKINWFSPFVYLTLVVFGFLFTVYQQNDKLHTGSAGTLAFSEAAQTTALQKDFLRFVESCFARRLEVREGGEIIAPVKINHLAGAHSPNTTESPQPPAIEQASFPILRFLFLIGPAFLIMVMAYQIDQLPIDGGLVF